MHKLKTAIIRFLDGKPADIGRKTKGQSFVELALTLPLFLILITGLVEIGWFTNNYLIMLEASRVAARLGTGLERNFTPIAWEYRQVDNILDANAPTRADAHRESIDAPPLDRLQLMRSRGGWSSLNATEASDPSFLLRDCGAATFGGGIDYDGSDTGFYELIACEALIAMLPLQPDLADVTNQDDIVISVFTANRLPATAALNILGQEYRTPITQTGFNTTEYPSSQSMMIVTGRYPANANECSSIAELDPFDFVTNNRFDMFEADATRLNIISRNYIIDNGGSSGPAEASCVDTRSCGYTTDVFSTGANASTGYGYLIDGGTETHRGWAYTGKHTAESARLGGVDIANCTGSNWSVNDVQTAINLDLFDWSADGALDLDSVPANSNVNIRREQLPKSSAFVLVELFWEHRMLLDFPGFQPLAAAFTNAATGEREAYIEVWALFPLPSSEFLFEPLCVDETCKQ